MLSVLEKARSRLFEELVEQSVLTFAHHKLNKGTKNEQTVLAASNSDFNNRTSREVSNAVIRRVARVVEEPKLQSQTLGGRFETAVCEFLQTTFSELSHLRPGQWDIAKIKDKAKSIAEYQQYAHLSDLQKLANESRSLAAVLGNDYLIRPDILMLRHPEPDAVINQESQITSENFPARSCLRKSVFDVPILHGCISCKFTLRSDRAQNARTEALNLIRNRKGKLPHIVVVTAECFPSRLASLALGTGDIDCLYHLALPELIAVVNELDIPDAQDSLATLVEGKRIKDLTDLPLDLAV